MLTLGIDMAAQAKHTGVCALAWQEGEVHIKTLGVGADDDTLLDAMDQADATGIDCPFGWPAAFHQFLEAYTASAKPALGTWSPEVRDRLRFRETDRHVRAITGRWPLSVSTDMIAVPTLRLAMLLARLGVWDRSGANGVYEVYPAAVLVRCGLHTSGYKKAAGKARREEMLASLLARMPWLRLTSAQQEALTAADDAFDAFIAALGTRAATQGLTEPPPPEHAEAAAMEGWIHVPVPDFLAQLL
ncbi:MAG: DUF429 domain-containing protein [Candidatus Hydrogenedentota bacterium]